ncbi:hypothetical protein [Cellulomonas dongxiuzhuiae]|uniref:ABC-2 type transport system permease protein n=1 Tax=Cellulomonas dongxiuzhuiae TaxID=2819979 RepID=A0ABX8GM30_9CELL|nr:hypothetical protein [Cellulomonas dongxiuzhuiae]MBO3088996.1 hypothetical protein [Cellulomonas dongxiuzhuiae]MBO3096552.1 hypothetical protein [Cellulomonas dongxiuzhuiae]QWC16940.1 hypothetical protein KKR89_04765 [Cellulomonas dongxiuzhuiae]
MVAHLVRLKLTLLRNGLRRSAWQVVGLVVAALYGLTLLGLAVAGAVGLGFVDVQLRGDLLVVVGSLLVLGWWVVPLVAFGVDATLDPRRFVTFGVPRRDLLVGLTIAGLIGIPGVVTTLSALATPLAWWREPLAALAALVGAVLAVLACTLGARATTTVLAPVIGRRRVREVVAALAILPFIFLGPILSTVAEGASGVGLESVARVLSWTPLGAAWALAPAVAAGDWGGLLLRLVVALATLVVALRAWSWALDRTLTEPVSAGGDSRARGLGWFGRLPATPTGAVAARAATYWLRDPRYAIAVAIVPVLPVLLAISAPDGAIVLVAGPAAAFTVGWSISADVAYDGTAYWTHLASPLRGLADRWGRVLVAGSLGLVLTLVVVVGTVWYADRWDALPALLGASVGLLLTALGGASVVSAAVVYPVQQPGENPFGTKQGSSAAAFTSQLVGFTAIGALGAPTAVLALLAVVRESAALGWAALGVGLVLGAVVLVVGVRVGGSMLDRRGPDLLQKMRTFA